MSIGRKSYGSIGHLPNSRLGPTDRSITKGQARIATCKARDKHDTVIVQEKLDGSCVAVARIGSQVVALGRSGYTADSSPHEQHRMFAEWVKECELKFFEVLNDGERIVGEWLDGSLLPAISGEPAVWNWRPKFRQKPRG